MTISNRIITRGFGKSRGLPGRAGPITQGYGGILSAIVGAVQTFIRRTGGRATRADKHPDAIVVWAKLVSVNGEKSSAGIQGTVKASTAMLRLRVAAEMVLGRARKAWEDVKISIKWIR